MSTFPIQPIPPVLTSEEVASVLRCSPETVGRYVHRHELVAIHIGRERRFRAEDVLEFIATRRSSCESRKRSKKRKPCA